MRPLQVLVMAKSPVPGRVKTRLCPPLLAAEAADVAEAALSDTLAAVAACRADHKVVALDGPPGPWIPAGVDVLTQREGTLDERLAHAWADSRDGTGGWGLQIGMDTPQVTSAELDELLIRLAGAGTPSGRGALLGLAADGGWWVIGLQGTDPYRVFPGVPMTTPTTGRAQRKRLIHLRLDVVAGPTKRDIDTVADLVAVAAEIPDSRTADAASRLLGPASAARAIVA
jgi:uncharacterized protein